ncbi:amidohydrolase family protein [Haliea atlantica]
MTSRLRRMLTAMLWLSLAGPWAALQAADERAPTLVIEHVDVISMVQGAPPVLRDQTVVIAGGRIQAVEASASPTPVKGAQRIDGRGRYLLPGLVDMHVHVWDEAELPAYLAYGVTTVRNASGMPFLLAFADAIQAGRLTGPELITTGPILNGRGHNTQANHQIVETAAEAREAVFAHHARGYRHLKVYSNLNPEAYRAIRLAARELGMSIMGHTPEGARQVDAAGVPTFEIAFRDILRDGWLSIEHVESIVWHALGDRLDPQAMCALAAEIAASGVPVTPTLLAHHNLVRVARSQGAFLRRPGVETMNPFIAQLEQPVYQHWASQPPTSRDAHDAFYAEATRCLHEQGVTLLAGSDAGIFVNIPGLSLLEELELLGGAGISPWEVLATATRNPARVLGRAARAGQIAPGFDADLLLLAGNPLEDLGALRQLEGLVVAGAWHDRQGVEALHRQSRQASLERSQQRILAAMAAQGTPVE